MRHFSQLISALDPLKVFAPVKIPASTVDPLKRIMLLRPRAPWRDPHTLKITNVVPELGVERGY